MTHKYFTHFLQSLGLLGYELYNYINILPHNLRNNLCIQLTEAVMSKCIEIKCYSIIEPFVLYLAIEH